MSLGPHVRSLRIVIAECGPRIRRDPRHSESIDNFRVLGRASNGRQRPSEVFAMSLCIGPSLWVGDCDNGWARGVGRWKWRWRYRRRWDWRRRSRGRGIGRGCRRVREWRWSRRKEFAINRRFVIAIGIRSIDWVFANAQLLVLVHEKVGVAIINGFVEIRAELLGIGSRTHCRLANGREGRRWRRRVRGRRWSGRRSWWSRRRMWSWRGWRCGR
jgi:hypothetical protein